MGQYKAAPPSTSQHLAGAEFAQPTSHQTPQINLWELLVEKKMLEKSLLYKWFKPILGCGLFTSGVAKWKQRKKLLAPCFHSDVLRGFLSVFNEQSR
ncbi:hypothetical protein AVEN_119316-1, partial [Araneus ventricosus]